MAIATPLSVSGRWITDANGNRVKLAGVNWAGAHQDAITPGGPDYRQRGDIASLGVFVTGLRPVMSMSPG